VRGLDYYTKTVFEVWAQGIGAQNAICGGGRYDGLAEELGGAPTPGIGFGSGMERIVLAMKQQGIEVPGLPTAQVAMVYRGAAAKTVAITLMNALREASIPTTMGFDDRSIRAQLRGANRAKVRYALIIGDDELADGEVTCQDMQGDAPRERVRQDEIVDALKQRL
jgi:histidyl-tRNA synthetase